MRLDKANSVRRDIGHSHRFCHDRGLPVATRRHIADLHTAIVVDGRTLDDGEDMIAVADRIR